MGVAASGISQAWQTFWNVMRQFTLKDAVDVFIVTVLLYGIIKLMQETRAGQLVKGIVLLVALFAVANYWELMMVSTLLRYFFQSAFIAVIILFQPEIRKALEQMGRSQMRSLASAVGVRHRDEEAAALRGAVSAVVEAAGLLQQMRMGALIVFERSTRLGEIIATGTQLDAEPSGQLIANIFFNKAPLHDGALVLRDGKIRAAGCILPLTAGSVSAELGTRHRAALGMSENSDALIVVVSEETGQISIAVNGRLTRDYTRLTLREALTSALLGEQEDGSSRKKGILSWFSREKED